MHTENVLETFIDLESLITKKPLGKGSLPVFTNIPSHIVIEFEPDGYPDFPDRWQYEQKLSPMWFANQGGRKIYAYHPDYLSGFILVKNAEQAEYLHIMQRDFGFKFTCRLGRLNMLMAARQEGMLSLVKVTKSLFADEKNNPVALMPQLFDIKLPPDFNLKDCAWFGFPSRRATSPVILSKKIFCSDIHDVPTNEPLVVLFKHNSQAKHMLMNCLGVDEWNSRMTMVDYFTGDTYKFRPQYIINIYRPAYFLLQNHGKINKKKLFNWSDFGLRFKQKESNVDAYNEYSF